MRVGMGALGLVAALGAAGCSGCEDSPAVPFKLSTARRGSYENPAADAGAGQSAAAATAAAVRAGVSFGAGTTQVELAGRGLAMSEGAIRAALEVDLNGDGTGELLLVTQTREGAPVLAHTRRGERGWALPQPLPGAPRDATCQLQSAGLELLSSAFAVARAELDCPLPPVGPSAAAVAPAAAPGAATAAGPAPPATPQALPPPSPPSPDPALAPAPAAPTAAAAAAVAAGQHEQHLWIVALESTPRVLERVAVPVPAEAEAPRVEAGLQSRDLDADGNGDLVLGLTARGGGLPETRVEVELWSRAGGLAVGSREPEATLVALADRAKAERKRNAARAGELANQTLGLHAALCRESGTALVRVGEVQGLPCGASLGAGRAASVQTAVLAAQGRLLEAIERYEALRQPAYRLTDNDWERAKAALSARSPGEAQEFRAGPAFTPPRAPAVHRAAIAFLDEQHLLLRGDPTRSYDLASGETVPIGMPGDTVMSDPSGRLAVVAVVRSCQGYHLSVVETSRIALGVVAGPSSSEPLIVAAPPPPNARCPQLSPEQRRDTGGLAVLAWTAQGVVLARGRTLLLLPLDAAGRAAEPARDLEPGAALSGLPAHGSELTPDGRYHALLTPLGVAIHDRQLGGARLLPLPADAGAVTDIAVSPSGQRLAIVRGGRVLVSVPRDPQAAVKAAAAPPR